MLYVLQYLLKGYLGIVFKIFFHSYNLAKLSVESWMQTHFKIYTRIIK